MADDFDSLRSRMVVGQMVARGIHDKNLLRACQKIERHLFVPKEIQDKAYDDVAIPIMAGQSLLKPYIIALMAEEARLDKDSKVLEIGTGSGYNAAILSEICKEVYTIEILEQLVEISFPMLGKLYKNMQTKLGDGSDGWEDKAPFDAIIVTAAPNKIPYNLIKQLKIGGRIIFPLEDEYGDIMLLKGIKQESGKCEFEELTEAHFDPMIGKISENV